MFAGFVATFLTMTSMLGRVQVQAAQLSRVTTPSMDGLPETWGLTFKSNTCVSRTSIDFSAVLCRNAAFIRKLCYGLNHPGINMHFQRDKTVRQQQYLQNAAPANSMFQSFSFCLRPAVPVQILCRVIACKRKRALAYLRAPGIDRAREEAVVLVVVVCNDGTSGLEGGCWT